MAAQYEAMSKRMHHGFAARNGFYAAGLAAANYTGIKRVFEREYGGFLSVFGEGHDPDASLLTDQLGERWETSIIMVKSYAVMGGLHGAVDAARQLRQSVVPEDISKIDITVGETVYKHGWWAPERPLTAIGAQMNIGYATAAALLDGNALPEQFTPARLDADDIWSLIDVTDVHLDESLADATAHRAVPHRPRRDHPRRRASIRSASSHRTVRHGIRSPTTNWSPNSMPWPTASPTATAPPRSNARWSVSRTSTTSAT